MPRSYSEDQQNPCRPWGLALLLALALPGPGLAHPELQSQIELLTAELELRPGDSGLLLRRADLHRRHGNLVAARVDLDAAARGAPPPELAFYRGRLLMDAGDPGAAERAFSAYLLVRPGHVKTLSLRAETRVETGRFLDAADDLEHAIAGSEHPAPSLFRRQATAQVRAGEPHWAAARSTADRGLERYPGEVSLLGLATDLALAMNDLPAAAAYLEVLPTSLEQLSGWQARTRLAKELAAADPDSAKDLADRARRNLFAGIDQH